MAYAFLGRVYGDIGEPGLSADSTRTAWRLRDRTSDAEKFFISANYDLNVTGNMEKAGENFELWEQTYPRDIHPPGLLSGMIYPALGKHEKAAEEAKKAIAIDPDFPFAYSNLATSYQFVGRLDEAKATFQRADDRKVDLPDFLVQQLDLAFVKGDQAEMERISALGHGKSGVEDSFSDKELFILAYSGHMQQARKKSQLALDLTRKAGQPERTALCGTGAAVLEALFGNAPAARRGAMAALELSKGRDVEYGAAFAMVLSGDSPGSQKLANDLEKRFPEDTSVQFSYLPELRALFALHPPPDQKSDPARAIKLLEVSVPYELGTPGSWGSGQFGILYPVYVRGVSYLAAHQGVEAAAEFQKILDQRGIVASDPIGALAHLQLGRALVLSGDKAKAKVAYQDFLALWKDADPDIPVLIQAREENAAL